jgi:hypothetical protein
VDTIEEKRLIYYDSEEHLVRRLGAAVVVLWREFQPDLRDKIIERAARVLDADRADHLAEELNTLVTQHCRKGSPQDEV